MTPSDVGQRGVVWFLNELAYINDKTLHDNAEAQRQMAAMKAKRK